MHGGVLAKEDIERIGMNIETDSANRLILSQGCRTSHVQQPVPQFGFSARYILSSGTGC